MGKNKSKKAPTKEKPNWVDVANLLVSFGLLVVAVLALIFK